jgi:surface antigen
MQVQKTAMALAILFGAVCGMTNAADASTGRNARETVKQQRVSLQQPAPRSAKPTATKLAAQRITLHQPREFSSISCVPFARSVTGMDISGNAHAWWGNAAGVYARGQRPEPGSILSFRSSGGMRMGHVAVVSRVINSREVLIDHANWEGPGIRKGTVMRGVSVVDASENNDWTSVRVQVGRNDETYGRAYPTNGFIYDRPAGATMVASRPAGRVYEEVAEAPAHSAHADHLAGAFQDLNLNAASR